MSITRRIPPCAAKVLDCIRKNVKRPRRLPRLTGSNRLRWFKRTAMVCCPMGLLPGAISPQPWVKRHLKGWDLPGRGIKCFAIWWDEQQDARAAVNAVWPKEVHS
ncbi:hypothetical protein LCGC14_0451030 [marine sediment metagenome]|uniref:Uncharacterized protein n=1 Tax=marine sediment metagenome TaxID=412755 RepID=A0A0F9T117_9ZZZZ